MYPLNCQRFFSSSFCVFIHFVEFVLHLRATRNLSTNFNSSICFLHMCKTLYDMKNSSVQWLFVQITGYLVSLIAIANKSYITIVHKCNYHDNIYYAVPSYPLWRHIVAAPFLWSKWQVLSVSWILPGNLVWLKNEWNYIIILIIITIMKLYYT